MDPDRLARLSEQQRACLRFVFAHMTSTEIAAQLGIAPDLVEREIEAATNALGAGDCRAAARMLAEHEGAVRETAATAALALREEQAPFETVAPTPTPPPVAAPPQRDRGMKWLVWAALAAVGAALAYVALR